MHLDTVLTRALLQTTNAHIEALEGMQIRTVQDLILYLPRSYEDLTQMQTIASAPLEQKTTIRGTVDKIKMVYTKRRKVIVSARFVDSEGSAAEVIWFNQPHIKRMLSEGDEVVLTGKLVEAGYKLQLQSPQFEKAGDRSLVHAGRLVPIYPQHDIINTKWLREKMVLVREAIAELPETLLAEVVNEEQLMGRAEAIEAL
ncbi:MAG TPA: hypothetical protein VI873_01000, partial [Candidatus Peribacteraceae bacterium]|nr:hypothetical protein [Candidatus Peribacteraceae bacterium]